MEQKLEDRPYSTAAAQSGSQYTHEEMGKTCQGKTKNKMMRKKNCGIQPVVDIQAQSILEISRKEGSSLHAQ